MSMPITRQSESFGYFDDGPRFARDRSSADLPKGLAGLVNSIGLRITAGMLNTRTAGPNVFNTDDFHTYNNGHIDPDDVERNNRGYSEVGKGMVQDWETGDIYPDPRIAVTHIAADDDEDDYDPGEGPGYPDWLRKNRGDDDGGWEEATKNAHIAAGWHEYDNDDGDGGLPHCPHCNVRIYPTHNQTDHAQDGGRCWRCSKPLTASRLAVNTDGMDPASHAYHTEAPYGPGGEWIGDEDGYRAPQREWNPDFGYEPTDDDERRSEGVYDDDQSGYNWGPEPDDHVREHELHFGTTASRHPFDREALAAAPAAAPQMPVAGGYQPAHRVGLPWRDQVIPGTVISLSGANVAVRWDDGQYSTEEPRNIQLL